MIWKFWYWIWNFTS